jgi:two-component system phosphate regulon response regulator OmpR
MSETPITVLIADDEAELRGLLQRYLGEQGLKVRAVHDTASAERLLVRERFDVLVLDVMMPGEDGLSLCRRLRHAGETVPILMLTARGDPIDRIIGLEMGADDYLPKPFNPRELLARIQAMVRRQKLLGAHGGPLGDQPVHFGRYTLHAARRQLERDGEPVALTTGEFQLLHALVMNPNRALGREKLIELVKGQDREQEVTSRSIDAQVMRLRRVIEEDPSTPRHIQTVWGRGYVFVPDGGSTPGGD